MAFSDGWGGKHLPIEDSPDLQRVLAIPRRTPPDLAGVDGAALVAHEMSKWSLGPRASCRCREFDPRAPQCITEFLPIQAWSLYEMGVVGGLAGAIPTGTGKSILNILAPLALGLRADEQALLLVPPTLVEQTYTNYLCYREHFRVPGLIVHASKGGQTFATQLVRGAPTLHVLPYSLLSNTEKSAWISNMRPAAIIADEADSLASITSARGMRVVRYFQQVGETTKFAFWTGSLSDSKIEEFAHLLVLALRYNAPVPIATQVVVDWGRCLNANPAPAPPGALQQLCNSLDEDPRHAFQRRLRETRGVVMLDSNPVITNGRDIQMEVVERQAPKIPAIIQEALAKVRDFQRPDTLGGSDYDEELVDPLAQAKCASEIASGMFYRWIFPRGEPRRLIDLWYETRRDWNRELREKMLRGEEELDSPKLCENAARRAYGEIPPDPSKPAWFAQNWKAWAAVRDRVQPATQAVRLHPFLVEDVANWATTNRGIVWYTMKEFAAWLHQLTKLPLHEGGPGAGELLRRETGKTSIICSVKSHGRGRDGLQHLYHHQLVAQMLSSSKGWQQLLARLLRRGQKCDVTTEIYLHVPELRKQFRRAMQKAEYVRDLLGETQTLLTAFDGDLSEEE